MAASDPVPMDVTTTDDLVIPGLDTYNSVWELLELDVPVDAPVDAKTKKPKQGDDPDATADKDKTKTQYWWKLAEGVKIPEPNIPKPTYVPFVDPWQNSNATNDTNTSKKRKGTDADTVFYLMTTTKWNQLRQRPFSPGRLNWATQRGKRQAIMTDKDGKEVYYDFKDNKPTKSSPYWVNFWDEQFRIGQNFMKEQLNSKIDTLPFWSLQENVEWEDRDDSKPGAFSIVSDDRTFIKHTDGFALIPKSWGGLVPGETSKYVKLKSTKAGNSNGEAHDLTIYDATAAGRGVKKDEIYIAQDAIDALRTGNYNISDHGNAVATRNKLGEVQFIRLVDPNVQGTAFWDRAYNHGLSKPDGKAVRSRNVNGLKLCFVVLKQGRTTVQELQDLVKMAIANATVPIRQSVTVVTEDSRDASQYNYKLSTSPFGDYETWIAKEDYISYLQSYPGYTLPDETKLKTIIEALSDMLANKRGPTAVKLEEDYADRLKKQADALKLPDTLKAGAGAKGISSGVVSIDTIRIAGQSGARKTVPSQSSQMGDSATEVAKAAGWSGYSARLSSKEDTTRALKWDSPGVYPSEWLHRSAFSWGNAQGIELAQSIGNFVFGSSEANSLMTRYEKAFQLLFLKERSIQKLRFDDDIKAGTRRNYPPFEGILQTMNTPPDMPIIDISADSSNKATTDVKTIKVSKNSDASVTSDDSVARPDYWASVSENPNLSFSLKYRLLLNEESALGVPKLLETAFFPFQRGFFTRIEADVDYLLLSQWAETAISKISPVTPMDTSDTNIPAVIDPSGLAGPTVNLSLNPLAAKVIDASSDKAVTLGSPLIVSPLPPSQLPHADVWRAATAGADVTVGGLTLTNASAVSVSDDGNLMHIPVNTGNATEDNDTPSGTIAAAVATAPLAAPTIGALQGSQLPTESSVIDAPSEITNPEDDSNIPKGFVLNGTVKLFGKFDEQIYVFYGSAANGLRQIVPIKTGTVKISDYLPSLEGSDFEAVQLHNVQLVYNEFTTATDAAGTWIQTDLEFSGPLQPVADFLKNVCHQDTPMLQVQGRLSQDNDWSKPIQLGGLGLRGIIPNMSAKVGGLFEITELGVSVSLNRIKESWAPYQSKWIQAIGFFGVLKLDMPHEMAPLSVGFSAVETDGTVTLIAEVNEDDSAGLGFAGVEGLKLSQLTMTSTFAISSTPSVVGFNASAVLNLRDSVLELSGFYTKNDWAFRCDIDNFDFAQLRDLYEDIFGAQLHISDHEIVLDQLSFTAGSEGISISGLVTVEGHTSASATISISRLGLEITGEVDDVHLDGDIDLKKAALDIFIGRQDDTTVSGPGTSFRFAITGTVAVASNEISASLFLDKDPTGKLLWTVMGSFSGAFSLSKIAEPLKGTFLDLSLHDAAFIASNVDGLAATGAVIPAAYPVVKGVQIAASLSPIGALDSSLGNKGTATSGLKLRAIYSATTSSFELAIDLASPRQMSMKSGTVSSGDISLYVLVSTMPTLVLNADFYVQVPNQEAPLKFSGGLSMNIDEAKLFIELANQWWDNPFGLSPQLRLGPDLALQIGIVYAGPIYPSEIGIAAGLAIGGVSGKAALSISEAPNDELIMLDVQNLGIQDLVSFASSLFEIQLPTPDDFLRFKDVNFYLSTGTTIGTIVYPPGASFSCDALIFGHEATIYCGVNKVQKQIQVKGSLQPIDIGPISVSGYDPGTPAQLNVQFGPSQQSVFISGGVRILDLDARIDVNAVLLPTTTFSLKSELDFSTHLTFLLEANMRGGSFTSGVAGLKALDFDVQSSFRQDILDYIIAQVNMQILTAKHAVDDGIHKAQATLDAAQAEFKKSVDAAQTKVDSAKAAYEVKVNAATGALAGEQRASQLKTQQLQASVDSAVKSFNDAVAAAQRALQTANDNRARAITDAQQKVTDAKAKGDKDIDDHLRNLNAAKDDMQRRFGDAVQKVQSAQNDVNNAQRAVDDAQRDVDNAKHELDNCHWYEKGVKAAKVAAAGTKLVAMEAGLKTATGVLTAAKAIIQGPGYSAAQASIDAYQKGVDAARSTANATLNAANGTLQETINAQNALVTQAQNALTAVQNSGAEKRLADAARSALSDYQKAEAGILAGLQKTVDALASTAEAVAFNTAQAALKVAQANTKDIDIAKAAVQLAGEGTDAVMDAGDWVVAHTMNILNVKSVDVTGDFRAMCIGSSQLKAHVQGTFAEQAVDFSIEFLPGQGEELVKGVFQKLMNDVKSGAIRIAKEIRGN